MPAPSKSEPDQALREIIAKGVNIGITFTSVELLGVRMTLADVIKIIEPLDRNSSLILLGSLNWHCMWVEFTKERRWREATRELDDLITQFLPPSVRLKARLLANDEEFTAPISEIALLTLAGLICRFALKDGGIKADTQRAQRDCFRALLGVQGGITGKSPDRWQIDEVFARTTQIVWRNISLQNMLGRDIARLHAYLTITEVGSGLQETVSQWFERHLGVCGEDYLAIANSLHGAASLSADFSSLFHRFPELERRMSRLITLCSTTSDKLAASPAGQLKLNSSDPDAINEAQLLADAFFRSPLLQMDGNVVCISSRLLFNRLHRGLHYLVAEPYLGDVERIKQVRAECGSLFERYILWLFKQFLPSTNVEIIHSFRIKPPEKLQKGVEPPERDIAVIAGKHAFVFEIKSAIPNLAHRRRANVGDFVNLFSQAVKQAVSSAGALLQGTAYRDVALTKPLPPVESVVPCVVCFEPSPLRFPVALEVEDAISAELNTRPFVSECGRLPVQMFDVEGIERFGDLFGLPSEWELLLDAIAKRSRSPHLRYKPLARASGIMAAGEHSGSSALPKLVVAAQEVSSKRWRELTPRSGIATPKIP
jgi:hypothetical protein